MSPTVFRYKGFRFYFFSREEKRKHVHVQHEKGEVKIWIEPEIELANNYALPENELNEIKLIISEKIDDIRKSWDQHFKNRSN